MALPIEQLTQRTEKNLVTYQADHLEDAPAEVLWSSTTNLMTQTITVDKSVAANQEDREIVDERLAATARL